MARTVLPVQQISRNGLNPEVVQPDSANDHSFDNTGHNNFLLVRNRHGTGANVTVTILTPNSPDNLGIADRVLTVPDDVEYAFADDGAVFTDETAQANSAATDDMTLMPASPADNDAYYFGMPYTFDEFRLTIGQGGAGSWTTSWEYWDGESWGNLQQIDDPSSGFTSSGLFTISWRPVGDWAPTVVNGESAYWIRARVTSFVSMTTQPLGSIVGFAGSLLLGPFPAAVYDTIDTDPDPDIDPAVFIDISGSGVSASEIAVIKLPGAAY